jgi:hypothetical protein
VPAGDDTPTIRGHQPDHASALGKHRFLNTGSNILIPQHTAADYEVFTESDNRAIAPFQAFWVKASGPDPTLSVTSRAKTETAEFYGKTAPQIATGSLRSLLIASDVRLRPRARSSTR